MALGGDNHAGSALHARLDDDGGYLVAAGLEKVAQGIDAGVGAGGGGGTAVAAVAVGVGEAQGLEEERFVDIAEGTLPARADGSEGVTVVGHVEGGDAVALGAATVGLVLDGHLEGDLDGGGAVLAEEDARAAGEVGQEAAGELDGGLVGDAEEGAVLEFRRLLLDGGDDVGMAVAVHVRPEGGDAVDVLVSGGVEEAVALGAGDDELGLAFEARHLRKRVPEGVVAWWLVGRHRGIVPRLPCGARAGYASSPWN